MHDSAFYFETINLSHHQRPQQGGLVHTSVRFPSPEQHSDGPLHFLVAMAVPFCPHGAPHAPGTHEDQPASPANKLYSIHTIHNRYYLNVHKS